MLMKQLQGMKVITDRGLEVGRVEDLLVEETSGKIVSVCVKPVSGDIFRNLPRDKGQLLLPYTSVLAVREFMIVSERVLTILEMKGRAPAPPPAPLPVPPSPVPSVQPAAPQGPPQAPPAGSVG
jgi:sporulation protein YlmC with PRC-barrel domain